MRDSVAKYRLGVEHAQRGVYNLQIGFPLGAYIGDTSTFWRSSPAQHIECCADKTNGSIILSLHFLPMRELQYK